MYHIHTTLAFVVSVSPAGEGNIFVTLFTEEFGIIKARAQSARVINSKLRFSLQEYSFILVSLVRGKDVWRITNAKPIYNIYFELKNKYSLFMVLAKIISLIRRMLPEEGNEEKIFNDFKNLCEKVLSSEYDESLLFIAERVFLLRMLSSLGYVNNEEFKDICVGDIDWSKDYLNKIESKKEDAIIVINNALKVSHL